MERAKWIAGLSLALLFALTAASSAQAQWFEDEFYIHALPTLIEGDNVYYSTADETFYGLYDQPGLWLFSCTENDCTTEPIDVRMVDYGKAYLFPRDGGLATVYDETTQGRLYYAERNEVGWDIQPLTLPEDCTSLKALTTLPESGLIYLVCLTDDNDAVLAWEEEEGAGTVWSAEPLPIPANLLNETVAVTSDGEVHLAARDNRYRFLMRYWRRSTDGVWHSQILDYRDLDCFATAAGPHDRIDVACTQPAPLRYVMFTHLKDGWHRTVGPEIVGEGTDQFKHLENSFGYLPDGRFTFMYQNEYSQPLYTGYCDICAINIDDCLLNTLWNMHDSNLRINAKMDVENDYHLLMRYRFWWKSTLTDYKLQYRTADETTLIAERSALFGYNGKMATFAEPQGDGLVPYVALYKSMTNVAALSLNRKGERRWDEVKNWKSYVTPMNAPTKSPEGIHLLNSHDQSACRGVSFMTYSDDGELTHAECIWAGHYADESITLFGGGKLVAAWRANTGGGIIPNDLYVAQRALGGRFNDPLFIDDEVEDFHLALNEDGAASIAYLKGGMVFLADESNGFTGELLDMFRYAEGQVRIGVADGVPHVFASTRYGVVHAWRDGQNWRKEAIFPANSSLRNAVVLADGTIYAAVMDSIYSDLYLMSYDGEQWHQELLMDGPMYPLVGMWSDGEDVVLCYLPDQYGLCLSTKPLVAPDSTSDRPKVRKKDSPQVHSSMF